jgi:hypothetical protein
MRYLAIPEMPPHSFWASLRHRGRWVPNWHAVADTYPKPIKTLCGLSYMAEAHRTWDQTAAAGRCPACDRLATTAQKSKGATFITDTVVAPRRP